VEQSIEIIGLGENQSGTPRDAVPLSKSANPLKTGDCSTVPPSEPLFGEDSVSAIQNTLHDDFSGGHSQHRRNRSQMSNPGDG
jgi:hypothetical protein